MTLDDFIEILSQLDASKYGELIKGEHSDDEYYKAQRENAGLMDWTSHYGAVKNNTETVEDKSVRNTKAWKVRKHLAKIVIDGIRFDKDHLNNKEWSDNDHMRELAGLVANYLKHNQLMHRFSIENIFYNYFRDWTKNNFDETKFVDKTLGYDMASGTYGNAKAPFNEESIKKRRSEFIKFWADHFKGRKGEDFRATYDLEPSDEDLSYWIENDWFAYFYNDPKRAERIVEILITAFERNEKLRKRFKQCLEL